MCYLCRQPVHNGYNHFYGQGGSPKPGRMCPLFTNNSEIHDSDVARGAKEAIPLQGKRIISFFKQNFYWNFSNFYSDINGFSYN